MKNTSNNQVDQAIERFALRVTARLNEGLADLSYDVVEQLRASRMQAVAQRRRPVAAVRTASAGSRIGSVLTVGGNGGSKWWVSLLTGLPVLALVAGIMFTATAQDESGTMEVAEVDAALLTDTLPPAAYADPGFAQFLKVRANERN